MFHSSAVLLTFGLLLAATPHMSDGKGQGGSLRGLQASPSVYHGGGTTTTVNPDGSGSVTVDGPYYSGTTTWGADGAPSSAPSASAPAPAPQDDTVYYESPDVKITESADGTSGSVQVTGPYYSGTSSWGKKR